MIEEIKKIKVNGKEYFITILLMNLIKFELDRIPEKERKKLKYLNRNSEWYCAYVHLDKKPRRELSFETFRKGNTFGIDTNHSWNDGTSLEQRKKDAILQIKSLIQDYQKLYK